MDRERLELELAGDAAATAAVFQQRAVSWDEAHRLLHLVWGNAKDGHYVKPDLVALQAAFYDLERESSRMVERIGELERRAG